MKKTNQPATTNRYLQVLRTIDFFLSGFLTIVLLIIIATSSSAVIRSDSVDYYTILQQITDSRKPTIVKNTHFVEQRSPGYSLISVIPYYIITFTLEPLVQTETVDARLAHNKPPPPPPRPPLIFGFKPPKPPLEPNRKQHHHIKASEQHGIPTEFLLVKDIFFKDFKLNKSGATYEWKIALALLTTSYILLFAGIYFSIKTLSLQNVPIIGASLPLLVIFSSPTFMHNIVITPMYATLAAFGLSAIFTYFYICSVNKPQRRYAFWAGLFIGLLVLTRLETVLIAVVITLFWIIYKDWPKLQFFILGGLIPAVILIIYNWTQYQTLIHLGILRGDINQLGIDWGYIAANLINPQSGIVFWSALTVIGLIGLFFGKHKDLHALGVSAVVVILLLLVRIPVMYKAIGSGLIDIGGVLVATPPTLTDALQLVQSDANRYITVLAPFAVVGLQNIFIVISKLRKSAPKPTNDQEFYYFADI